MSTMLSTHENRPRRAGFTLIEMTIVIAIIAILAGMALSVYATAAQQARGMRTRSIIAKIDQLIGEKYESYRTRQVPIRVNPLTTPQQAAAFRLNAIRELQRFEVPDRITDVTAGPGYIYGGQQIPQAGYPVIALAALPTRPSLNKQYLRRAFNAHAPGSPGTTGLQYWSSQNENAECLYLILSAMRDGDKSALDYFSPTEIGDVDDDGMNEILDSWGQPIAFLRWAPAYNVDMDPYPVTPQTMSEPDPFDPFKIDPRWNGGTFTPFTLKPLIWSSGPDKIHSVNVNTPTLASTNPSPTPYALSSPPNDPFFPDPNTNLPIVGQPTGPAATDNITNHDLEAR